MFENRKNQSLSSVLQLIEQNEEDVENISPHLSAIQSIDGSTPGEKYRILNEIVKNYKIMEIPTAIEPLVMTHVDIRLKSKEAVVTALRSEDKTIVNRALKAEWFFDSSNEEVNANYFISNVMPHVSVRTRFRITKILSKTLLGSPEKAEIFFTTFTDLYGFEESLPLLFACGEDFIFGEIVKRRIILSHDQMLILYKRHPKLVIRYLNLGNDREDNEDRKLHSIDLNKYIRFMPLLVKRNVQDFIELLPQLYHCKLGSTVTNHFFKQCADVVIKSPREFFRIWSVKTISSKLTTQQFEAMYENLFSLVNPNLYEMLQFLDCYPREKRLELLTRVYNKSLENISERFKRISHEELELIHDMISEELYEELSINVLPSKVEYFDIDVTMSILRKCPPERKLNLIMENFKSKYGKNLLDEVSRIRSEQFLKLLPPEEMAIQAKRVIDACGDKTESYRWYKYLPMNECFPVYKEVINKSSGDTTRYQFIEYLLQSCVIHKSKSDFLDVLRYYNSRHKNERMEILAMVLLFITDNFDLKSLDREHWMIFLEIMKRAHTKSEITRLTLNQIGPFFGAAVFHVMIQNKENSNEIMTDDDKSFLDVLFDIVLDYNLEAQEQKWTFLRNHPVVQRYCLERLLNLLSLKYPPEHQFWHDKYGLHRKNNLVIGVLKAMLFFNERLDGVFKRQKNDGTVSRLSVLDHHWMTEAIQELINSNVVQFSKNSQMKRLLLEHEREYYGCVADVRAVDVRHGGAWQTLRTNPAEILNEWESYLDACRERLNNNSRHGGPAARRFLMAIKWHDRLPFLFVRRCLEDVTKPGSIKVLGILLEGEVFGKLIMPLVPQESTVNVIGDNAMSKDLYRVIQSVPPAMNFTNPPVSLDVISLFCQKDFVKLANQAFNHASQRVSRSKILSFAESLMNKPVSVKKHGVRLFYNMATTSEWQRFVKNIWLNERHVTIRELIANMVHNELANKPNDDNWELARACIDGMSAKDEVPMNVFCNLKIIQSRYAVPYILRIMDKIEGLPDGEVDQKTKETYIVSVLQNISNETISHLPEEAVLQFLDKYYYATNSENIFNAARNFASRVFAFRSCP